MARPSESVPAGPTYTACLRSSRNGTTSCQPRPEGLASCRVRLNEIGDQTGHVGIRRFGLLVRLECVTARLGVGL